MEDLDLSVSGGVLKLRGRRSSSPEVAEHQFRRSERAQGQWERSFTLPERVNEHELHAELVNGVLKAAPAQSPLGAASSDSREQWPVTGIAADHRSGRRPVMTSGELPRGGELPARTAEGGIPAAPALGLHAPIDIFETPKGWCCEPTCRE